MRVFRCFCFPADLSAYTTMRGALGMDLPFVRFPNLLPWGLFEKGLTANSTIQPFCVVDFLEEVLRPLKNFIEVSVGYLDGEYQVIECVPPLYIK